MIKLVLIAYRFLVFVVLVAGSGNVVATVIW